MQLRPDDLTADQLLVIDALIDSVTAWESPGRLAVCFDLDIELVEDALADLDVAGWVEPWEESAGWTEPWNPSPGIGVTFTVAGASALGIRLVEDGDDGVPRWARSGEDDPPAPKARAVFREYASLALVVDPTPGPFEQLIINEGVLSAIATGAPSRDRRKRDARLSAARNLEAKRRRKLRRIRKLRLLENLKNTRLSEGGQAS